MLFWALLASGQITMRKVDGWQTLAEKPTIQCIDLAPSRDNVTTPQITRGGPFLVDDQAREHWQALADAARWVAEICTRPDRQRAVMEVAVSCEQLAGKSEAVQDAPLER